MIRELIQAEYRFPCLTDEEHAAQYYDRNGKWYKAKAAGYYMAAAGWPLVFGAMLFGADGPGANVSMAGWLFAIGGFLLGLGYSLMALCAYPGTRTLCARWLAKPTWWNRTAYVITMLAAGWATLHVLVSMFGTLGGGAVFFTDASNSEVITVTPVMEVLSWVLGLVFACAAAYLFCAYSTENTAMLYRVFTAKAITGWSWRNGWWPVQVAGFLLGIGCLIYSGVLLKRGGSELIGMADLNRYTSQALSIMAVSFYAIMSPFIKQAESVLDEIRRFNTYKLSHILTGILLTMAVLLQFFQPGLWYSYAMLVLAVSAACLLIDACLGILHDKKYFDIINSQGVTA